MNAQRAKRTTIESRAGRRPEPGVEYRLRVIEGSGGQLEIVEQRPRRSWYHEWVRAMAWGSPWGF